MNTPPPKKAGVFQHDYWSEYCIYLIFNSSCYYTRKHLQADISYCFDGVGEFGFKSGG